jgi:hypothetical protein
VINQRSIGVDPYSLSAVRLTMMRGSLEVATGSGVLWQTEKTVCLVTAWHCLTGTHPTTRQSLSPTGARPDKVKMTFVASSAAQTWEMVHDLYTQDDATPSWVIHRLGSDAIDVAVLPLALPLPPEVISHAINKLPQTSDLAVRVGSDLFILGFPRNLHRLNLPIWKRASLAIDPAALLDEPDGRHLLVDTATREGISGGVVVARYATAYPSLSGAGTLGGGPFTKVVGIYSGRIGSQDQLDAQIGIVWPIRYVEEIIANGIPDRFV